MHPTLALVAAISAVRAAWYAEEMARFQILRASSIRAFKVATEASTYAREAYRFARGVPDDIPRISLDVFVERVIFKSKWSETTKSLRDKVFQDEELSRFLSRCDRSVARSELFPSYRESIVSKIMNIARGMNPEIVSKILDRLDKLFKTLKVSSGLSTKDIIRQAVEPELIVLDPYRSLKTEYTNTRVFYTNLNTCAFQWEHPLKKDRKRFSDSYIIREQIEKRERLEEHEQACADTKFKELKEEETNRRAMAREDCLSNEIEEQHRRIPESREMKIQLAHAKRFRAIKSTFTAHKRPFMSRYKWLYTIRTDRDSHLHRVKCATSGHTLWMRETILHRDAATRLLESLEKLKDLNTLCLAKIIGVCGCPAGNERWRVCVVTERCIGGDVMEEEQTGWSDEKTLRLARVLVTGLNALHTCGLYHGHVGETSVKWYRRDRERMCVVDYALGSVCSRKFHLLSLSPSLSSPSQT